MVGRAMAFFRRLVGGASDSKDRCRRGASMGPRRMGYCARQRRRRQRCALPDLSRYGNRALVRRCKLRLIFDPMYIELHTRSAFSFLEGASVPEELAEVCHSHAMPAMALLDRRSDEH